jgi:D-aspartate ligase
MTRADINILLLGIDGTQTLPIAKSLCKVGYGLIGTYSEKDSYGVHTKYIHEKINVDYSVDSPKMLPTIIQIIKDKNIGLIIPFGDATAEFLSKNKKILERYTKFTIPEYEIFLSAYDKNKLMALCEKNGYPHPITVDLSKEHEEKEIIKFPYPALIKPNITTGGRGMTLVFSSQDFYQKIDGIVAKYGDCHLQQFIPKGGRQIKVQIFFDKKWGKHYSSVIYKQRYYPENGGSSCCNVTIRNDDVVEMCLSVLEDLGWEGFADFDLIEDPRDHVLKIMEINPRVPACLKSAMESGIDYGNIMADYALGNEIKDYKYNPGAKLRHIGFDVLWFLTSKNRFKAKPSWFLWGGRRLSFQDFSLTDPFPFFWGTWGNIKKMLRSDVIKEKSGLKRINGHN